VALTNQVAAAVSRLAGRQAGCARLTPALSTVGTSRRAEGVSRVREVAQTLWIALPQPRAQAVVR